MTGCFFLFTPQLVVARYATARRPADLALDFLDLDFLDLGRAHIGYLPLWATSAEINLDNFARHASHLARSR